jgi:hypothetical protein
VGVDRIGLAPAPASPADGLLAFDDQQACGGQRPRQTYSIAAAALERDRDPRPRRHLGDRGQQGRETTVVIADPHRRDRRPGHIRDFNLVAVAVGVDPDDGVYHLCQHGHTASCSFQGWGPNVGTGLGGVTERHICDGSRHWRTGF